MSSPGAVPPDPASVPPPLPPSVLPSVPPFLGRLQEAQDHVRGKGELTDEERARELELLIEGVRVPVGDGVVTGQTINDVSNVLGRARRLTNRIGLVLGLGVFVVLALIAYRGH